MLRHPAAVLCQVLFRVAAGQLAPVQAGALKQRGQRAPDGPASHRTAVAVIGVFAGIAFPMHRVQACGHCTRMSVDFFSLHCSFCPGKGWGLLGRVSGITFMSPNVLKSNNANTRVFSVNGAYLGYQLLLFAHIIFVTPEELSSPSPFVALALSEVRRKHKTCALRLVFAVTACMQKVPVMVLVYNSDK